MDDRHLSFPSSPSIYSKNIFWVCYVSGIILDAGGTEEQVPILLSSWLGMDKCSKMSGVEWSVRSWPRLSSHQNRQLLVTQKVCHLAVTGFLFQSLLLIFPGTAERSEVCPWVMSKLCWAIHASRAAGLCPQICLLDVGSVWLWKGYVPSLSVTKKLPKGTNPLNGV
jgi:hypothetical protein